MADDYKGASTRIRKGRAFRLITGPVQEGSVVHRGMPIEFVCGHTQIHRTGAVVVGNGNASICWTCTAAKQRELGLI